MSIDVEEKDGASSESAVLLNLSSLPANTTESDIEDLLSTDDDDVEVKRVTLLSSGNATAEVTGLQGNYIYTVYCLAAPCVGKIRYVCYCYF